jgi:hypothetical protein
MTDHPDTRTDSSRALFSVSLRLVAQKIPPEALAWLWTIHRQHGEWDCPAHTHGETCCVDVLLEHTPAPVASREIGNLAEIILAGYDIIIEAATDDRNGELHIILSHPDDTCVGDLKFAASPVTLGQGIERAAAYAVAFPQGKTS